MQLPVVLLIALAASIANASRCDGTGPQADTSDDSSYPVTLDSGRQFLIHLPSSYDGYNQHKVYFSFHGGGKNASNQESLSSLSDPYFNPDGIAIYPHGNEKTEGSGKRYWLSNPGIPQASPNDIDFVLDIIDHINDNYCIDNDHLYATGKSNGGGFVNLLACNSTTAATFKAFAAVSGAHYENKLARNCDPGKDVAFISFHGLNDSTISYEGEPGEDKDGDGEIEEYTKTYPIATWLEDWEARNGIRGDPVTETLYDGSVERYTWSSGANMMQHYKESDLGHVWPSTLPNLDCPHPIDDKCPLGHYTFNATSVILDFFENL